MDSLHDYSSSSSESDDQCLKKTDQFVRCTPQSRNNKAIRPPPPDTLEVNDADPSRQKRLRTGSFTLPRVTAMHEKVDRYLMHVFLPLEHPQLKAFTSRLLGQARLQMVGKPLKASLTPITDFHISISRPTIIRSEQIRVLEGQLRAALSQCKDGRVTIMQKPVAFHSKNQRRLYIAAPAKRAARYDTDFVLSLIRIVSGVFQDHGLAPFFDDPRPHMSFAWTETTEVAPLFPVDDCEDKGSLDIFVRNIVCVIGKSEYNFELRRHSSGG